MQANSMNRQGQDPKSFFINFLIIILLFASMTSFINLCFRFIDLAYSNSYISVGFMLNSIRFNLSILLIAFIAYCVAYHFLRKSIILYPEKAYISGRKFLIYASLFLIALVMIIDLIYLLYHLLNGSLVKTTVFKSICLLITLFYIGSFYRGEIKQKWLIADIRAFGFVAWVFVIGAGIYGFYLVGTPSTVRKAQLDQQRISDLISIQAHLRLYQAQNGHLPKNLSVLAINNYSVPTDPQTDTVYTYHKLNSRSFQLCSQFSLASSNQIEQSWIYDPINHWNWQHDVGLTCFTWTMDPEIRHPVY